MSRVSVNDFDPEFLQELKALGEDLATHLTHLYEQYKFSPMRDAAYTYVTAQTMSFIVQTLMDEFHIPLSPDRKQRLYEFIEELSEKVHAFLMKEFNLHTNQN